MKTTITFVGANEATKHLLNKTFSAEIVACSAFSYDSNMYIIKTPESEYLFDLKEAKVLDSVVLYGILQDEDTVGRVAIQLS